MEHSDKNGVILSETSGYTIDNLDTKTFDEAVNDFEKIFIEVREIANKDETIKDVDLHTCHQIARHLSRRFKIEG